LVDGFDARVAKLAELLGSDAVEVFDGVVGTGAVAAGEEGAVVRGGAVGAGGYIGERGLEHLVLGRDLGRDAWAELGNGAGDVGAREEWAVVRVAVLVVEMHELDAPYPEACLFNDVGLDGGVGEVLGFYSGGARFVASTAAWRFRGLKSMRTAPGNSARARSPTRVPMAKISRRLASGRSSGARRSWTFHQSWRWHWWPAVNLDLERRWGLGGMGWLGGS
jgi:hypothetical protein